MVPLTEYIGERYVPVFSSPSEVWNSDLSYEPLTVVRWETPEGDQALYVSKTYVPANVSVWNTRYWSKWSGPTGPQGPQGVQGPQGPSGNPATIYSYEETLSDLPTTSKGIYTHTFEGPDAIPGYSCITSLRLFNFESAVLYNIYPVFQETFLNDDINSNPSGHIFSFYDLYTSSDLYCSIKFTMGTVEGIYTPGVTITALEKVQAGYQQTTPSPPSPTAATVHRFTETNSRSTRNEQRFTYHI